MIIEKPVQRTERYAVIYQPTSGSSGLQAIRERHDPTARLIGPHVTLVFPFDVADFDQGDVIDHVLSCARRSEPFDVHFSRTELSWDQWLFLVADTGRRDLVLLHDRLYTGIFRPLLRPDIPFVPHFSLGYLGLHQDGPELANPTATELNEEKYRRIRADLNNINLNYHFSVDHIKLIGIDAQFASTEPIHSFRLGA